MSERSEKILLADDEHDILALVNFYLQRAGYDVILAENGREAVEKARAENPSLAILDRTMPEMNGDEVCRELREFNPGIYIIMLTALGTDEHRIGGLEAGADDYIVKPFNPTELLLKVKAMLRHVKFAKGANYDAAAGSDIKGLELDQLRRQVLKDGDEIELTKLEFDLLKYLWDNPNLVFSRGRLLEQVWNYDYLGDERVVDVHMARLRKKLEDDPSRPRYIQTIRGVGYKYTP